MYALIDYCIWLSCLFLLFRFHILDHLDEICFCATRLRLFHHYVDLVYRFLYCPRIRLFAPVYVFHFIT